MKQKKILKLPIFCAIYGAVIVASILLDQLTKYWVFDSLLGGKEGNSVSILGKFLRFYAVLNEGAAFGMGSSEASNIVFFVVTLFGIPMFCWLLLRSRTRSLLSQISFALIIGGTIGNAIDRSYYASEGGFFAGKVRDFISFSIFPPVFNVADLCLTGGVFMAIAAIVYFDPDSLVKLFADERKQKLADQMAKGEQAIEQNTCEQPMQDTTAEQMQPLEQNDESNPTD